MIPFKVQFDKLTQAYIEGKVDPYKNCACFIGNLLNGTCTWAGARYYRPFGSSVPSQFLLVVNPSVVAIFNQSEGTYTPREIIQLENLFLRTLEQETVGNLSSPPSEHVKLHHNYEEALFKAFCVTLDKLKEIHISKGEDVEEFTFTKRKLEVA